jgi:tetratricopeptide (TPR) repeat protein
MKPLMRITIAAVIATPAFAQTDLLALSYPRNEAVDQAATLMSRGEYRKAIESYDALCATDPIARNVEYQALIIEASAEAEIELGDSAEAGRRSRTALSRLVASHLERSAVFALVEATLSDALRVQGRYREAMTRVRHAMVLGGDTLGSTHPAFGLILTSYAGVLKETGDLRRAEEMCRRAISIFENTGKDWQIPLGTALGCLAVVQEQRKRPKSALESIRRALAVWNSCLPAGHPFFVYGMNTEMVLHSDLKQFRAAEDMIPDLIARCLSRFGPSHPERLTVYNNAAAVYFADRKYTEAERLLKDNLAAARRLYPPGHPTLAAVLMNYSEVLRRLHRTEEATVYREESNIISASALAKTDH